MISKELTVKFQELLAASQSILVIFSPKLTYDQAALASGLYLSLQQHGKDVRLLSPLGLDQNPSLQNYAQNLTGLDQTSTELGHQNLLVSFEYNEDSVDKVSYHIGEQSHRFYLTIKPKPGVSPLDISSVEYSYSGAQADLVILVGVNQLDSLDQLYFGYEDLYANSPVVTINNFEPEFGVFKLDVSGAASQSEVVARLLTDIELPIGSDVATNLLSGIEDATQGFRSMSTTAETFETVAKLLHFGARRSSRSTAEGVERVIEKTAGQKTADERTAVSVKSHSGEIAIEKSTPTLARSKTSSKSSR